MFEYTEAEVEEEVEKWLLDSKIGFTWMYERASSLQSKLNDVGYDKIRVLGLTERKFVIKMEDAEVGKKEVEENLKIWLR